MPAKSSSSFLVFFCFLPRGRSIHGAPRNVENTWRGRTAEKDPAGDVLFTDQGDVREANAVLDRIRKINAELTAIQDAHAKEAQKALDRIRRH